MALKKVEIEKLAGEFLEVRAQAGTIEQPTLRYPGFSLAEAYSVADFLRENRVANGYEIVGKKIGFTNQAIWPALGIGHPIWATLYQKTVHYSQAELSLAGMAAPRIEPEIVFKLKRNLIGHNLEAEEILAAMEWYALGFEIVDCNFPDWKCTPNDAITDFGLHAALMVGETRPVRPDFGLALAEFSVKLYQDDKLAAEGAGHNVLGSPALAINWLLATLRDAGINGLQAGEVITTGTLTDALPIAAGQSWRFEVSGLDLPSLTLNML